MDKKKADLSAHIAELDKQLATMDAEIKKSGGEAMKALIKRLILTPKAKLQRKRPEYGYHSTIVKNPRTAKWVQIDLGVASDLRRLVLRVPR